MKRLKIQHRKAVHYALLGAIVLLQILAILTWYNETRLAKAFNQMSDSNKILKYTNLLNGSLLSSQAQFNQYIANRDEGALKAYSKTLDQVHSFADSLHTVTGTNPAFAGLLKEKQQTQAKLIGMKSVIDSIIAKQTGVGTAFPKEYRFEAFASEKFLDNIETKTYIKVKDAGKKGFFSRIGDAFSGKVNVKKEYINTVVTVKFKDKTIAGEVEKQMEKVLDLSDAYYKEEFENLRQTFASLREGDGKLMELNNKLLQLSNELASSYNKHPAMLGDTDAIKDQYESAKTVRNYTIVVLILLMLGISVVLFRYTREMFDYEKKLTQARDQIGKSLAFKNRITGVISHEIRSPLSIISTYSKKAAASVKDDEIRDAFRSIEYTTNSLLLLSNQILEYSKDETQPMQLSSKEFNLKTEMDAIARTMETMAQTRGNKLEASLHIANENVQSDIGKIHQLFYNIVGNANKFTENGLIRIDAASTKLSDFEIELSVIVADTGIGIGKEDLKHIFESHYQGAVSDNVKDLGIGLGLNICREIVHLFEGTIRVESEVRKGTTVTFNLVLALV